MCDPVTLGLGMAASAAGGLISGNSNLNTAQKPAAAENGVLSEGINSLDKVYSGTNALQSAVPNPSGLADAQAARSGTMTGNMVKPDGRTSSLFAPGSGRAAFHHPRQRARAERGGSGKRRAISRPRPVSDIDQCARKAARAFDPGAGGPSVLGHTSV
jgi:hypothetical protein